MTILEKTNELINGSNKTKGKGGNRRPSHNYYQKDRLEKHRQRTREQTNLDYINKIKAEILPGVETAEK